MKRSVYYGAEFVEALRRNLTYLREKGNPSWTTLLEADLIEFEILVVSYPRSGKPMASRKSGELRKLRLKRTPFVVWYVVNIKDKKAPVTVLRLFHVRQRSALLRF